MGLLYITSLPSKKGLNIVEHIRGPKIRSCWKNQVHSNVHIVKKVLNALTAVGALRILIDFTLSNARRFYSSVGNPLAVKGLMHILLNVLGTVLL